MDSFSVLDPRTWSPGLLPEHPAYAAGNALGWLYRGDKQAATSYPLSGRLYLSKNGWLLLAVPNALVRGVFDALTAPGAELPTAGVWNLGDKPELLNAHISVMTGDEVSSIGADKINERGHMFGYTLGALREITPSSGSHLNKIWVIQVSAPGLSALRKSYGLSALPNDDEPFHITIAVRRRGVLLDNGKAKGYDTPTAVDEGETFAHPISRGELKAASDLLPGGEADNTSDSEFPAKALAAGAKHEHEHTDNDQIAKEIAKDHLSEDPRYYQKIRKIEPDIKLAEAPVIEALRQAKAHSDAKRYDHKNDILRRLIAKAPQDWEIDDPEPHHQGITHKPTKFRFHADRSVTSALAKAASVYGNELMNTLSLRRPIVYDANKPVFENLKTQAAELHRRGSFILQAKRNQHLYRAAIDPKYRYQRAMQAFNGEIEQPEMVDQLMERYGDSMMGALGHKR